MKQVTLRLFPTGPPVGPVVGPSAFKDDGLYCINAHWPEIERAKWEQYLITGTVLPPVVKSTRYSQDQKEWLKRSWGGEYRFLRAHGLSIFSEADRQLGQSMVRAIMVEDEEDEKAAPEFDTYSPMVGFAFSNLVIT
jgi:hypothetical protein